LNAREKRPRRRRQAKQLARTLYVAGLLAGLLLIPVVMLKQCIAPPKADDMAAFAPPVPVVPPAALPDAPDHEDEAIPVPDPDDTPDSDTTRPPDFAEPIHAATDRGPQQLRLSARRCQALHPSFQAEVIGDGLCEVWIHELARQDGAIWLTASPRHGVMDNGRPVVAMLPETALP